MLVGRQAAQPRGDQEKRGQFKEILLAQERRQTIRLPGRPPVPAQILVPVQGTSSSLPGCDSRTSIDWCPWAAPRPRPSRLMGARSLRPIGVVKSA